MVLSETNTRVLLTLATKMATITETPEGLLVVPHQEVRRWDLVMLVGLMSPFDGIFDMWNSVIRIPRGKLPDGFNLNPPPDEAVALSYAESKPAEPVAVKLSQKQVYVNQLKENFRRRMSQEEVTAAVRFLLSQGMSADQIVAETGASLSTVYRSLRLPAETVGKLVTAVTKSVAVGLRNPFFSALTLHGLRRIVESDVRNLHGAFRMFHL